MVCDCATLGHPDSVISLDSLSGEAFSEKQLAQFREVLRSTIQDEIRSCSGGISNLCRVPAGELEQAVSEKQPDVQGPRVSEKPVFLDPAKSGDVHGQRPHAQHLAKGHSRSTDSVVELHLTSRSDPRHDTRVSVYTNSSRLRPFRLATRFFKAESSRLARHVNSHHFDIFVGFVIVLNAISIGIETQQRLEGDVSQYLRVVELVRLGFFLTELALRLHVNGCKHWRQPWFCFDACLILFGLVSQVVLEPLKGSGDVSAETQQNTAMVLLLRLFRLMRVVRALRFLGLFSDMWKMCNGLVKSATTMLSVLALFGTVIFVFACLGLDLISQSSLAENDMTKDIVAVKFSSLPTAMLTLLQFSNADSTAAVYEPLIHAQPLLALYFGALWLILSVALMNVITAVILESALAKSKEEAQDQVLQKRKMFKKVRPQLVELFQELDTDNSGYISLEEIQLAVLGGKLALPEEIGLCLAPEQIIDTFDFLDADMDGQINSKEFVEGVLVLVLSSVSVETAQLLHLTRMSYSLMAQTSQSVKKIEDEMSQARGNL